MGCYGIGVSRVMGVIVEKFADEKGLVWPEEVAPFKYHVVAVGEKGLEKALEVYKGHEEGMLLDDREARFGEKMKDSELMGLPYRVLISDRTLEEGQVEITERSTGKTWRESIDKFIASL